MFLAAFHPNGNRPSRPAILPLTSSSLGTFRTVIVSRDEHRSVLVVGTNADRERLPVVERENNVSVGRSVGTENFPPLEIAGAKFPKRETFDLPDERGHGPSTRKSLLRVEPGCGAT